MYVSSQRLALGHRTWRWWLVAGVRTRLVKGPATSAPEPGGHPRHRRLLRCGAQEGPWHFPTHCPSAGAVFAGLWAPASSPFLLPPRHCQAQPSGNQADVTPMRLFAVAVFMFPRSCDRNPAPALIYIIASAPRRVFLKGIISINFN